jgi:hypothetical protein
MEATATATTTGSETANGLARSRLLAAPVRQGRQSRAEMGRGEKNNGGGRQDRDGEGGMQMQWRARGAGGRRTMCTHGTESNWLSRIIICLLASCRIGL